MAKIELLEYQQSLYKQNRIGTGIKVNRSNCRNREAGTSPILVQKSKILVKIENDRLNSGDEAAEASLIFTQKSRMGAEIKDNWLY